MIYADYFSPTGGVKKLVCSKASSILYKAVNQAEQSFGQVTGEVLYRSFTKPAERASLSRSFLSEDFLVLGLPVYAGRIPNLLLSYLKEYNGNRTPLYLVFGYGNRHFDDAPKEAYRLFKERGFVIREVICAVCEHSFSSQIARGEPTADALGMINKTCDLNDVKLSALKAKWLKQGMLDIQKLGSLDDDVALKPYFQPIDSNGQPFNFVKIKPETISNCISCGRCSSVCPMDAISSTNYSLITGKCIKCCACVKACPVKAKVFTDQNFIKHKYELEEMFTAVTRPITVYL
ncbi:MAG: hypothetical protein BGO41_04035 [Clostridiales bacterium 38-18]|nr:MAG: hypothetical protein BGO41_04035 [Clostridiales bacterium 38-18]